MNCLITGGAGHIGSHLALRLHEEGHDVDIIDNLSISKKDAIQDMINQGWEGEFVNADLRKPETVSELLQKKKYDVCFHLAGYTVPEDSKEKPIVYYENNISPFPQFLSSLIFHNVGRLVICSNYDTVTPYGLCSGVVERMIKEVSETTPHLKYSCFMLPEVVGNNIDGKIGDYGFEKKNKLIPNCMSASAKLKENVTIDNGGEILELIHVDDAVNFLIKALEDTGNNTHNVGCAVIATVREIIDSCIKVTAGSYPVVQNRCDEIELGEDTRFRLVAKDINITCLDVITKSTWNWIKKVKNLP